MTPINKERFKMIASVYLFFVKNGKILLLQRANTGYEDGKYGLVAGHADGNEALTRAAAREAREEAGVVIKPHDLMLKLTMHRKEADERVDFFFEVRKWKGEVRNAEPKKCSDLSWFPIAKLPKNTIPYVARAIDAYQKGVPYLEIGFGGETEGASRIFVSYLMGAPKIKDKELKSLGVKILGTTPSGDRKLEIPEEALKGYEKLIIDKLSPGFWSEVVGRSGVIFLFKFAGGEVRRLVLSEGTRLEIAKLCSKFSRDPIEKTSDVLRYLMENSFYRDFITTQYGK